MALPFSLSVGIRDHRFLAENRPVLFGVADKQPTITTSQSTGAHLYELPESLPQ